MCIISTDCLYFLFIEKILVKIILHEKKIAYWQKKLEGKKGNKSVAHHLLIDEKRKVLIIGWIFVSKYQSFMENDAFRYHRSK